MKKQKFSIVIYFLNSKNLVLKNFIFIFFKKFSIYFFQKSYIYIQNLYYNCIILFLSKNISRYLMTRYYLLILITFLPAA